MKKIMTVKTKCVNCFQTLNTNPALVSQNFAVIK